MKKPNSLSLLIALILLISAAIMASSWLDAAFVVVFTALWIIVLRCSAWKAIGPVLSIWPFFVFILLLNSLFGQDMFGESGKVFWSWWIFTVTENGIRTGVWVVFRCIAVSVLASAYIAVSSPLEMTDSMTRLLSPLGWIGLPIERFSFILSMSLFFVPEMKEESERILRAQRARGAVYGGNGLVEKARSYVPLMIPLFVSALRRADEMSRALVSRGYNGERKMKRKPLSWNIIDIAAIAVSIMTIWFIKGVI